MADFTVEMFLFKHGKQIVDSVFTDTPGGVTIIEMCVSGAFEEYGFDEASADELTNSQRELVAVQALYELLNTAACKDTVEGAITHVEIGSDGTPAVSFADRLRTADAYRKAISDLLTQLQRKNGFVPYLAPDPGDVSPSATFVDFIPTDTGEGY